MGMKHGNVGDCPEMGNDLANTEKGKQVMGTESLMSFQHKYPEPLADYKDVIEDRKLFMDTLAKLHATMRTKFMIPVIAGRELDLHQLFVEVTSRGGIEKAISDRKWREIIATFNFPSTATNASFVLRKYYMSLLHNYEKIYFFGSQGWKPTPPASSNNMSTTSGPSGGSAEPILQPDSSVPGVAIPSPGPSELLNSSVSGVIDGKFGEGYFITVTIGTQELKGVLYHTPQPAQNQAAEDSGIGDTSNERTVRHGRRRKLGERDPAHPKPSRSGYNFFFKEQHARLKSLHSGKVREISKTIGNLWNRLTEAEKAVYQERGLRDQERYRSEMAVYKEGLRIGLVIRDAVPIQQRLPVGPGIEGNLPEGDENSGSSFGDGSETDGMMSDDGSESASMVADPSIDGDGFDS